MKLQKKMQRTITWVIVLTLIATFIATTIVLYRRTLNIFEADLKQEADYMIKALELSGEEYLDDLDAVRRDTRVTLIDPDGNVLYDHNKATLNENHKRRREVIDALKNGEGTDVRRSATLDKQMIYYAERMDDGNIFRVSRSVNSVMATGLSVLPWIALFTAVMVVLAWRVSKWQVRRIIAPINEIDVKHPQDNEIYEELEPLLRNIEDYNREKDEVARMRKEFTANVSHELKTPLTSIQGYAELLKNDMVKPKDIRNFAGRIYDESHRMIALVDDVIRLSRLDEEVEMEKEDVDLFELTRDVVDRLAPLAAEKNVHIQMAGEPVVCHGVKKVLDEMITNICENAVKYNKENGTVDIWIGGTLEGTRLIVQDNGIGIPEDQQERVFERFYRVDKSHSRKVDGTGLGLSIVKHGAILHNAQIRIESKPGEGTKVEIDF